MAKAQGVHIKQWFSGLKTNRAATNTPVRRTLGGGIPLNDTLIDGLNMEITPANTLARRPGWPKYCSASFSGTPEGLTSCVFNGTLFKLLDTSTHVSVFTTSAITDILTKASNSTQSFFKQVGNVLFFSDGAENKKWTGYADANALTLATPTNNGIVAPTLSPTISNLNLYDTVGTTQYPHAWVAGYTYSNTTSAAQNYFFLAPTGEIQWAVIARGTTLTSAKAAPNWAATFGVFGARTIDGEMLWTNCGPIGTWAASTAFTNAGYVATHPLSATSTQATITTSGSTSFNWHTGADAQNPSGTAAGIFHSEPTTGNTNTLKITGLGFNVPAGATITGIEVDVYRRTNRTNGVNDVTVKLLKAGTPTGNNKATSGYWPVVPPPNLVSTVIVTLPDERIQGTGGVEQVYGGSTDLWGASWTPSDINDANFGIEIVANVASTSWTTAGITYVGANAQTPVTFTVYYIAGASDISGTVYAQVITDSNNNLQRVKTAGTSGSSEPSWSTTIGGTTTDSGITWECLGTANQLPVLFNWSYAYSYHTADNGNTHTSTLSPLLTVSGPIIGNSITLGGTGSSDTTQCDRADLYRTADGGSLLLFDTSTPNVNGAVSWTDTATDQDLNFEIIGPVANANDPPPAGMTMIEYHQGRLWGAVGSDLFFSAGPDCINGDGAQAWPPANVFTFDSQITALAATSLGLVVWTIDGQHIVLGGPQTQTFWVKDLNSDRGVLSQNCVAQDGDRLIFYTTNRQLFLQDPQNEEEIGFPVAPTLAANFSPSTSIVCTHRSGQDNGIFISDGSTNTMRYNLNAQSWDTLATPAAGIGPLASIQTAIGTKALVSTANGFIVNRDTTVFQDSGSSYTGFATVGSITLSESGSDPASLTKGVLLTYTTAGSTPTVSVLPNEVSGSFTTLPNPVNDPPQLVAPSSINSKRWDWMGNQSALPNWIRHVQVKVAIPSEAAKNEIYTLGLV